MAVTIKGSGQVIVQIVQVVKSDTFTTSSSSFVDITGLSVSITPTSASNRILIIGNTQCQGAAASNWSFIRLMRDSTPIFIGDAAGSRPQATGGSDLSPYGAGAPAYGYNFLDSPATTSAITYKMQVRGTAGSISYINRSTDDTDANIFGRFASSIIVMEVSG